MPRLPRNLHLVATWRSPDNGIRKNTPHDTSKVLRLPRKMTMDMSKVLRLPRKLQRIFWKRRKSIALATKKDFSHGTTHVGMSRSATPAARNEATRRFKPPKMTPFAELTIGTAILGPRRRLRTVGQRRANTPWTPRPPEWNGNPCYAFPHSGKNKWKFQCFSLPYLFTRPEHADDDPTTSPRSAELEAASSPLVLLLPRRHFSWDQTVGFDVVSHMILFWFECPTPG